MNTYRIQQSWCPVVRGQVARWPPGGMKCRGPRITRRMPEASHVARNLKRVKPLDPRFIVPSIPFRTSHLCLGGYFPIINLQHELVMTSPQIAQPYPFPPSRIPPFRPGTVSVSRHLSLFVMSGCWLGWCERKKREPRCRQPVLDGSTHLHAGPSCGLGKIP